MRPHIKSYQVLGLREYRYLADMVVVEKGQGLLNNPELLAVFKG